MSEQDNFAELLYGLDPESGRPKEAYQKLRFKLIRFFAWKRLSDPESLADETIMRLVRHVHTGGEITPANPYSFVYAVAKNVFHEHTREQFKRDRLINNLDLLEHQFVANDPNDPNDCRRSCFERLAHSKQILLRRYFEEESRDSLAQSMNMSTNALRIQVYRIRSELKACYEDCMKSRQP